MSGDRADNYSEDEVALILRRAAEIQPGRAMSLEEVEAVAAEAGIDRALVRRAATELRELGPEDPASVPGGVFGSTATVIERVAPGAVDPSMWGDIVAEIRRHVDSPGQIEEVGKELIWSSRGKGNRSGRDIRVIVTARRDKTIVRVEEKTGAIAGALYGGLMGGLLAAGLGWIIPVCIVALNMPGLIAILLPAWFVGSYLLTRRIYTGTLANRRPQLKAIAEGVADLSGELVEASSDEAP